LVSATDLPPREIECESSDFKNGDGYFGAIRREFSLKILGDRVFLGVA
jgi:hypothetical protein